MSIYYFSIVRTLEGQAVLFCRPELTEESRVLLDPDLYSDFVPKLPRLAFAWSLSATRKLTLLTNMAAYQSELPTLSKFGISSARVAAGWTGKEFDHLQVSSEVALSSDATITEPAYLYLTSLLASYDSIVNLPAVLSYLKGISDQPLVTALARALPKYGYNFLGPLVRNYFLDAVVLASKSGSVSAVKTLGRMAQYASVDSTDMSELPLDLGISAASFRKIAPSLLAAVLANNQAQLGPYAAVLVLGCMLRAFVPVAEQSTLYDYVEELLTSDRVCARVFNADGFEPRNTLF